MHVEVTRMVTAWLEHETYGVNALLPGIPRFQIDGETEDPEPPLVTVFNDVDFALSGIGGITPPMTPSIVVVSDGSERSRDIAQPNKAGHEIPGWVVGVGYYAEPGYREAAIIAGNITLRAVAQSIRLFHGVRSAAYKELNGVMIARFTEITMERVAGAVPDSTLLGLVFAELTLVNKLP